jgi:hypothetical protein
VIRGPIRGESRGREIAVERPAAAAGIASSNSTAGTVRGPKSASARPGPCTRPRSADALTRREIPPGPTDARRQARSYSAAGVGHRDDPRVRAACGRSSLTPGPGRTVPRRAHRAGPIAELLGGGSELTRCPRRTGSSGERIDGRARWRRRPGRRTRRRDRADAGGLPAQRRHNKMRAHGHASDLPERPPRDPSLHLTAPDAIPPLSCGNTLQPGAARGVASWPLPLTRKRTEVQLLPRPPYRR